jgi:lipopolysaccharide biosynthesis glycosyltransferase
MAACSSPSCCARHPRACVAADGVRPHVTFVAFGGKDRGLAHELARSAFSLTRTTPSVAFDILTDGPELAEQLAAASVPSRARVHQLTREAVLRRFHAHGLYRFAHHSGLGGYAKLLLAELLPADVSSTILVDTDTLFVADIAPLWALRHRLAASGGVLAAKRLSTGGACLRGQRLNSGVVLMDVQVRSYPPVATHLRSLAFHH